VILPEYTLLTDICDDEPGWWRFVLMRTGGTVDLDVTECEPGVRGLRLELLALVRGLEALDQPSHVTLVTASRYVRYAIEHGLPQWRANGWTWEAFDQVEPIKHADLWRRLERARSVHCIRCAAVARRRVTAVDGGVRDERPRRMTRTHYRLDEAHRRLKPPSVRQAGRARQLLRNLIRGQRP